MAPPRVGTIRLKDELKRGPQAQSLGAAAPSIARKAAAKRELQYEAAKVMADDFHGAAMQEELAGMERYLRRALQNCSLRLTAECAHYG